MLNDIVLQVSVEGRWRWHLEPNKDYIVVGVYRMLTSMESVAREDANDINFVKSFSISKKKISICLAIITQLDPYKG